MLIMQKLTETEGQIMKKRITAVLMSAALLMSAGCAAQTVQNQGSVPDSGAQEKTQSTAQKETSTFEQKKL